MIDFEVAYRPGTNVITVRMVTDAVWKQRFLLLSDMHLDSDHCDRALLKDLLEEATSTGAGIFHFGDLLDMMQGRNDRRGSKSQLKPEYKDDDYVGEVKADIVRFLRPYAGSFVMMGTGNHDLGPLKWLEYDLLDAICRDLEINRMGYSGFIRFQFSQSEGKGNRTRKIMHFHHGSVGGETTMGIQRVQRDAAKYQADIYVSGHQHQSWLAETKRVRVNDSGHEVKETETHISIPSLKDEHDSWGGYHIEKDRSARPTGGFWLEWKHSKRAPMKIGYTVYKAG